MNYQYKAAAAITAHALKWNGARNEFVCRLFSFGDEQAWAGNFTTTNQTNGQKKIDDGDRKTVSDGRI